MKAALVAILALLFVAGSVAAQGLSPIGPGGQAVVGTPPPPTSGNPIGAGIQFSSRAAPLFANTSSTLQFGQPYSVSFWVQTNNNLASAIYRPINGNLTSGTTGVFLVVNESGHPDAPLTWLAEPGAAGGCPVPSRMCTRATWITDGNLDLVTITDDGTTSIFYVNAVVRDQNGSGTYTPGTGPWSIGLAGINFLMTDVRVYTRALVPSEVNSLYVYGRNNQVPANGSLTTGMAMHLPMSASTFDGTTAIDTSGSSPPNNFAFDTTPPVVAITAPTNGATLTGAVSLTATCIDNIACASVTFYVDGFPAGIDTASPFTLSFDSTLLADGAHTVMATGADFAGNTGSSSTINVTSSNSITGVAWYFSSSIGNDSWDCKAPAFVSGSNGPCATLTKLNSQVYHAADTINLKSGDVWTVTDTSFNASAISLRGPSSGLTGGQNVFAFPSAPITIQPYGGGTCAVMAGTFTGCAEIDLSTGVFTGAYLDNIEGATLRNIRFIGTLSAQLGLNAGNGIHVAYNAGTIHTGVTITGNEVKDLSLGIYYPSFSGPTTGTAITNNLVHASTRTATADIGIWMRFNGNTGATIGGNLVENMGGHTATQGAINGGSGNGILIADGASNIIDEWNVTRFNGANTTTCGGPAGNWTYDSVAITIQFNESYNQEPFPSVPTGPGVFPCDWDNYDLDGGVRNSVVQYNYSHGAFGAGYTLFNNTVGSDAWSANTLRYNISENDNYGRSDGTFGGAVGLGGGTGGPAYIHNNTIANTVNGTNNPIVPGGTTTHTPMIAVVCSSGGIIANNIAATTKTKFNFSEFVWTFNTTCSAGIIWKNNAWVNLNGGTPQWNVTGSPQTTLAGWQGIINGGDTNAQYLTSSPFAGTAGAGGACYVSGIPAGPQPCPSGYQLVTGGSLIGAGLDLTASPYSLNVGTKDYYGNTIPNGVGTGYNIGADGARH